MTTVLIFVSDGYPVEAPGNEEDFLHPPDHSHSPLGLYHANVMGMK